MMFLRPTDANFGLEVKKNGFSFFELLLATILLTIGLVSLMNIFSLGFSQSGQSKDFLVAKNLLEAKSEEIRNVGYPAVVPEEKAPIAGFPGYERQVDVSIVQSGLKQVRIDVFWQVKGGETNITLTTFVSDI